MKSTSLIFVWALLALFLSVALLTRAAVPTELSFKRGQQIVYNFHANIDARGQVTDSSDKTRGSVSTMDSTFVIQCQEVRANSYLFVMNLFDTSVSVQQEKASLIRPVISQAPKTLLGASPLGYDLFFEQQKNGQITTIWYDRRDETYVLNVKISAINSLQTRVTQPGQTLTAVEQDPTGVHTTQFVGTVANDEDSVHVVKTFGQKDFQKFSDPNLSKDNVVVEASATTKIHSSGIISGSTVEQSVTFVNMKVLRQPSDAAGDQSTIGFDMDMKSRGVLSIGLRSQSIVTDANSNGYFAERVHSLDMSSLVKDENLRTGSFDEIAAESVAVTRASQLPVLADHPSVVLKQVMTDAGCVNKHYNTILHLIAHLNQDLSLQVNSLLEPFFVELANTRTTDKIFREKLLFIATSMNREHVHGLLVKYGLMNMDRTCRYHTIVAINSGVKQPSSFLITSVLQHYYANTNDVEMSDATLLAFGSLLSSASVDRAIVQEGSSSLVKILSESIKNDNTVLTVSALGAISNAGGVAVPLSIIPPAIFSSGDLRVRMAAAFLLRNYHPSTYPEYAQQMMKNYPFGTDPDFPYNKNYTAKYVVGGDKLNADFNANLFIGTNFDCNHPDFNYKALAEGTAHINVFGVPQPALDARAIYGKRGGQVIGNELFLSVFGKVIYQKSLPVIDCFEHSYALYHAAPGLSVKYIVWVSVVPVTFKASASLVVDAAWGWQICESQLSAMAQIIPTATLIVAGNAEIDLLIVRGGIELNSKFNAAIIPQAYVHGTTCKVGINVNLKSVPMSAALEGYYATKVCHFLKFFDCKWDKQGRVTFWSWSMQSQTKTLYNQEWDIRP